MTDRKYSPVKHDRKAFVAKAKERTGFAEAYESFDLEYRLSDPLLNARTRAGLTQDAVAERMGATKTRRNHRA